MRDALPKGEELGKKDKDERLRTMRLINSRDYRVKKKKQSNCSVVICRKFVTSLIDRYREADSLQVRSSMREVLKDYFEEIDEDDIPKELLDLYEQV
jgi:hypothetical protein